jgi:hypothetical protein
LDDFFALFGASDLAASSAKAANEVARMRAAISFFMWGKLLGDDVRRQRDAASGD